MTDVRKRIIELLYVLQLVLLYSYLNNVPFEECLDVILNIDENVQSIFKKHSSIINNIKAETIDEKDEDILKKIFNIYSLENEFLEFVYNTKNKIIEKSGGIDENNKIKNPNDKNSVKEIMIKNEGEKEFYNLYNEINEEITKLCEYLNIKNNSVIKKEINFNKTSLISCFNFFLKYENSVVTIVDLIFDKLFSKLNEGKHIFKDYCLIIVPKSQTVIAGQEYEASVFLNVPIKDTEPEIKINDNEQINVDNGVGKIKIKTSKNIKFDEDGKCIQYVNIKFTQKTKTGEIINLKKNISFTVINKKNISGNIKIHGNIYKYCKNLYTIENSYPKENELLYFTFDGGKIIVLENKQANSELILVPYNDKCTLHVYEQDIEVFTQDFNVQDVPMPKISVFINNKNYDEGSILDISTLREINIDIVPDNSFKSIHSEDSDYEIKKWRILFCKNNKIISERNIINSEEYTFNNEDISQKCDKIIIQIEKIYRKNFEKNYIDVLENNMTVNRIYKIKTKEDEDE